MAKPSMEMLTSMRGKPVTDRDGSKIGNMETLFYDQETGMPEWIGLGSGFFGTKRVLVPVEGAQVRDGQDQSIQVPYSKDQVKSTPDIDTDEIPEETEHELYAHYGLEGIDTLPKGPAPELETQIPEPQEGTSLTRHEEEMHVGKRERPSGYVRLRKWVETEPVSEDVTLRRESARVEREAVDRPAPGAQFGEQEVEMELHEEEPVVGKEAVEKERVTLEREEEAREETVHGEVRKERVEVEGEEDEPGMTR